MGTRRRKRERTKTRVKRTTSSQSRWVLPTSTVLMTSSFLVKSVPEEEDVEEIHTTMLMMKIKSSLTHNKIQTISQVRRLKVPLMSLQELPPPTRRRSRKAKPRRARETITKVPQMVIFCETSED